ncbi:transposase [Rhizobium mongolense]|uniref:Transposase n=1 Tax=Rhizobium mongolense TaxID=57676 RepID=A0ABR6IYT3_9HYPH|nr:transposase [Rhizobium mongolense]
MKTAEAPIAWRVISPDSAASFRGWLLGYTNLAKTRAKTGSNETIQLAGCWAHAPQQAATDSIFAMTELWRIEDEVRGKDAGSRAAWRQEKSAAIVSSLFDLWEKELGKVSGKSKTAEAIRYALTRREALERFMTDGRIEIDSNIVERAIRPQTITRKRVVDEPGRRWPHSCKRPK